MSTLIELNEIINLIETETQEGGNTKERIAKAFKMLRDLEVIANTDASNIDKAKWQKVLEWSKKLNTTDFEAFKKENEKSLNKKVNQEPGKSLMTDEEREKLRGLHNYTPPTNLATTEDVNAVYERVTSVSDDLSQTKTDLEAKIETKAENTEVETLKTSVEEIKSSKVDDSVFEEFKTANAAEIGEKLNSKDFKTFKAELGVQIGESNTIKFDKEYDYGSVESPLDTFSIDKTNAKRGVVNQIFFNSSSGLPSISEIDWRGDEYVNGENKILILEYVNDNLIIGRII